MGGEPRKKTVGLADSLDGKTRALTVADVAELAYLIVQEDS